LRSPSVNKNAKAITAVRRHQNTLKLKTRPIQTLVSSKKAAPQITKSTSSRDLMVQSFKNVPTSPLTLKTLKINDGESVLRNKDYNTVDYNIAGG